jgi:hypothetical protein
MAGLRNKSVSFNKPQKKRLPSMRNTGNISFTTQEGTAFSWPI